MNTRLQVAQNADGRWYWAVIAGAAPGETEQIVSSSAVSFDTMENAQIDFDRHDQAPGDGDRKVRQKQEIHELLRQAMGACQECAGIVLAMLQWQERDQYGNNWDVAHANGPDVPGCLDRIRPAIVKLQRMYNIPDEG